MEISTEIKRIRQSAMLSQEELARELGVSFATVNRWETGRAKPTYRTLRLIDEYCKNHNISFDVNNASDMT
ncbi:MAG: helix-turn-helix transcriptional regulator [Oscillospiraceae bacterium]|nr:helix-turn-helix transcriptional regulator [Oscillospiraceae bacterium]